MSTLKYGLYSYYDYIKDVNYCLLIIKCLNVFSNQFLTIPQELIIVITSCYYSYSISKNLCCTSIKCIYDFKRYWKNCFIGGGYQGLFHCLNKECHAQYLVPVHAKLPKCSKCRNISCTLCGKFRSEFICFYCIHQDKKNI